MKRHTAHIEQEVRKVYGEQRILISTSAERACHVVEGAFAVRRIVIFSDRAAAFDDDKRLDETRAIHAGDEFGSIIGYHPFQRPKEQATRMLAVVMDFYAADGTRTC